MTGTCQSCAAPLKPNAKFCTGCGARAELAQPSYAPQQPGETVAAPEPACPACALGNLPTAKFCRHCGAAMDGSASASFTTSPDPAAPNADVWEADEPVRFWRRKGVIPGLAALLLVIVGLAWFMRPSWLGTNNSPAAVSSAARDTPPLTGQQESLFVTADANVRDAPTAKGSAILHKVLRGTSVSGTMQIGTDGESRWFKLTDGRGFVGATNLASAAPPELSRVFDNMPWNVEGATELLIKPEAGSQIVARLTSGERTTLAGVTKNGYAEVKLKNGGVGYFIVTNQTDTTGVLSELPKKLTLYFNHDTCDFGPDFRPFFKMALRNAQELGKNGDGVSSYVKVNGVMFGLHPTAVGAHYESSGIYFQEDAGQVVKAFLDHGFKFEKNGAFVGYSLIDGSTSGVGASISDATGEEAQYGKSSFSCGL